MFDHRKQDTTKQEIVTGFRAGGSVGFRFKENLM